MVTPNEDLRYSVKIACLDMLVPSGHLLRKIDNAKEKHGMRYTLHRSLNRVRNWVRLKLAAMNLKKLAMWA